MVVTNDAGMAQTVRALRDWDQDRRGCDADTGQRDAESVGVIFAAYGEFPS
ncbi:MAG: hypothetical protein ACO1SX_08020 [Actinomycetota bacterium]